MATTVKGTAVFMAAKLSEMTGATFTVIRLPLREGQRYCLKASRDDAEWVFWHNGLTYNQMTLTIASILDMLQFGFIRVR